MSLNPFRLLADTQIGRVRYTLRAWAIATLPGLALFLARVAGGAASLAPPPGTMDPRVAVYSIFLAPIVETALMFPVAWLLIRAIADRPGAQILVLAGLFALVHWGGGGWVQAFNAFWPFLVYSATLLAWWPRSKRVAFALTALVHALYNAAFFAIAGAAMIVEG